MNFVKYLQGVGNAVFRNTRSDRADIRKLLFRRK